MGGDALLLIGKERINLEIGGRVFKCVSKSLPLPYKFPSPGNLKTFLISLPWVWKRFQIPGGGNLKIGGGIWKRFLNSPRESENVFKFLGGNLRTFSNSRGGEFGRGGNLKTLHRHVHAGTRPDSPATDTECACTKSILVKIPGHISHRVTTTCFLPRRVSQSLAYFSQLRAQTASAKFPTGTPTPLHLAFGRIATLYMEVLSPSHAQPSPR